MHRFVVLAPVLLVLSACNDSDSNPDPSRTEVENSGVAAERVLGSGVLRLVAVPEIAGDLDGDGDTQDIVLHVLDLELGTLGNTGLALDESVHDVISRPQMDCSERLVAALVDERDTGRDVDGDGTANEILSVVFDRSAGNVEHLPFAHVRLELAGDIAAFVADAGTGLALHVFDARDGSLQSPASEPAALFEVRDGLVVFALAERGAFDLNGDGDATDAAVVHVYDADARQLHNTGFAMKWPQPRPQLASGFVGFDASEAQNGGVDLDGDGDADDVVFVAVDVRAGLTRVPGFTDAGFLDQLDRDGERFLLAVSEGSGDRNGDGDTLDTSAVVYDPRTELVIDPGVSSGSRPVQSGPWLGLSVSERGEGIDLDGDGELWSHVPHVLDTRTGALTSLGFRGGWLAGLEGHLLGVRTEGGSDFTTEQELFGWRARDGAVRLTGFDTFLPDGVAGDTALFTVPEDIAGQDLNRDGDALDIVLAYYDGRTSSLRTLGLAVVGDVRLERGGRAAVLVPEADQGADLDGDGQLGSWVLHTVNLGL